jgi:hypothetical protein
VVEEPVDVVAAAVNSVLKGNGRHVALTGKDGKAFTVKADLIDEIREE